MLEKNDKFNKVSVTSADFFWCILH